MIGAVVSGFHLEFGVEITEQNVGSKRRPARFLPRSSSASASETCGESATAPKTFVPFEIRPAAAEIGIVKRVDGRVRFEVAVVSLRPSSPSVSPRQRGRLCSPTIQPVLPPANLPGLPDGRVGPRLLTRWR